MHIAVLLKEVLELLAVKPGGVLIDGTLGMAGHASEMLAATGRTGRLLGIDKDVQVLELAREKLGNKKGESILVHGSHGDMGRIAGENGFTEVDAILLDLGVSSLQLDTAERGFSFMRNGALSMKMDVGADGVDAAMIVAEYDEKQLAALFRQYGEEPRARRIARAIVKARTGEPIETTLQLADIVERSVGRTGARNPATRVFQALRMKVNSEIEELEQALEDGLRLLKPGGRMAVISFESLSDRIVKRHFADHSGRWVSLQKGGERWEGLAPPVKRITRKPVVAGDEEIRSNPRSRSAKLRVVERLEGVPEKKKKRY
ncbi:MAG: 16S rRNA (cytosine(1402)-N(4))-methyltransferase RsmH [Kiritimatiellia bacterium]